MSENRAKDEFGVQYTGTLVVTTEDIADIMDAAGYGINYWADAILHVGEWLGDDTCEHLANGGKVIIRLREPIEEGGKTSYEMDRDMLLKGIGTYLSYPANDCGILFHNGVRMELDTGDIDAEIADMIIQYALFNELVFG